MNRCPTCGAQGSPTHSVGGWPGCEDAWHHFRQDRTPTDRDIIDDLNWKLSRCQMAREGAEKQRDELRQGTNYLRLIEANTRIVDLEKTLTEIDGLVQKLEIALRGSWEKRRRESNWPTPTHMRSTADALDAIASARYGDVLRWVADACDGRAPS